MERAECAADEESVAVQAVGFRADHSGFAAGGTSMMCSGCQEPCRASGWCSCRPLRFYGRRNELDVQRTARALPCKRLSFVQSASLLHQAEHAECAADVKSLAVQAVSFVQSASVLHRAEQALCAADSEILAMQPVGVRADRSAFTAGGTS